MKDVRWRNSTVKSGRGKGGGHDVTGAGRRLRENVRSVIEKISAEYGRHRVRPRAEPLGSLVQTILSQNTTDLNSGRAYRSLRRAFPRWSDVLAAGPRRVEAAIRVGGLARQKAGRIVEMLKRLEYERGEISLRFLGGLSVEAATQWLTSFNGVGLKTAYVVLAFACGREVFPVDTHVARVSGRLGWVPPGTPADEVCRLLEPAIPPGERASLHLNMIRLGRELCRARNPRCRECFLRRGCRYYRDAAQTFRKGKSLTVE